LNGYRSRQQSTKRHDFIAPQMDLLSPAHAESTGCERGDSQSLDYSNDELNTE